MKKYDVSENILKCFSGEVEMYIFDGKTEVYRRGDNEKQRGYHGKWWAFERMSIEETRNKLAVCSEWGMKLKEQYAKVMPQGTRALIGRTAPQTIIKNGKVIEYREGGAIQLYILDDVKA